MQTMKDHTSSYPGLVRGGHLWRPGIAGRLLHRLDTDGNGADVFGRDRLFHRRSVQAVRDHAGQATDTEFVHSFFLR